MKNQLILLTLIIIIVITLVQIYKFTEKFSSVSKSGSNFLVVPPSNFFGNLELIYNLTDNISTTHPTHALLNIQKYP